MAIIPAWATTDVIPLGWENPLRLAEDLATVDILSGGRLNPGVSVGEPMNYADVREALYPDTGGMEDFGYQRVARLLSHAHAKRLPVMHSLRTISSCRCR